MVPRLSRVPRIDVEIPDEVAAAFRQALKLRDHREYQIADSKYCLGVGLCEVCNEYERLVAVVDAALKVKPSELSPLDVIDGPAPPMWKDDVQADWDRARAQHLALAKAAQVKPRAKALITDVCRGQCTVRWAERFCQVPDGPSVGQPFRLLEFQRDVIRGIYRDPRYWSAVPTVLKNGRRRKVATATPRLRRSRSVL